MSSYSGISEIFGIGDSQTTWLGRSLYHNKLLLKLAQNLSSGDIVLLGSGALEPIEISKLDQFGSKIIAVDFNKNVQEYYNSIAEGSLIGSDIEKTFKNKLVGKKSIRADYKTKLDIIKICNVKNIELKRINIKSFFLENKKIYKIIIAHNLINNLRFQNGYKTNRELLQFYKHSKQTIIQDGYISLVDNYQWFQERFDKQYSTVELIEKSGLQILYHYPAYASLVENKDYKCINENNNLILSKKYNKSYLDIDIKKIKKYFLGYLIQYDIQDIIFSIGDFSEYINTLNKNVTNLILLKIGVKKYLWLNIGGGYNKVFTLLSIKGFYPKELWYFLKKY